MTDEVYTIEVESSRAAALKEAAESLDPSPREAAARLAANEVCKKHGGKVPCGECQGR
jgi:hypothetical protein